MTFSSVKERSNLSGHQTSLRKSCGEIWESYYNPKFNQGKELKVSRNLLLNISIQYPEVSLLYYDSKMLDT